MRSLVRRLQHGDGRAGSCSGNAQPQVRVSPCPQRSISRRSRKLPPQIDITLCHAISASAYLGGGSIGDNTGSVRSTSGIATPDGCSPTWTTPQSKSCLAFRRARPGDDPGAPGSPARRSLRRPPEVRGLHMSLIAPTTDKIKLNIGAGTGIRAGSMGASKTSCFASSFRGRSLGGASAVSQGRYRS